MVIIIDTVLVEVIGIFIITGKIKIRKDFQISIIKVTKVIIATLDFDLEYVA